jgi:hypothetical protein
MRPGELERGEAFTIVGVISQVALSVCALLAFTFSGMLALVINRGLPPSVIELVFALFNGLGNLLNGFSATYLIAFSVAGARSKVLAPWMIWIGYLAALVSALAIPAAVIQTTQFYYWAGVLSGPAFFVWMLVVAFRLYKRA